MDMLMKLWLAILAAGAGAWVWGFLSYAVLGVHGGDSKKLPAEESLLAEIKRAGIPPGEYQFPWVEKAQQKDPEVQRKWKEGPVGQINLWGPFSIPRNMLATFVVNLASHSSPRTSAPRRSRPARASRRSSKSSAPSASLPTARRASRT